ncbi:MULTISPECIES: RDD family protein [Mycobacterium]|uniref:Membrane protein n=1 Tax=Mycobacterium kiyosense TaxID=2871094 RepID=A0A9P3Q7Q1_9MYCO|nr:MULTISPECIES: RDD family protein [Mycobacterium]BDB39979.1 membrane protein [Mycobacterium kiyosense]BDE11829.1 membrane protein [Mycobacterium sp. 20KCMC460]GLB86209.1 membrane protein [Mycobacterium kiyosense]GLB89998.1 membrane protein [Mycobacterium kiyosense]GLB95501.1 membrane protein [Mycobacterium kiyosense]
MTVVVEASETTDMTPQIAQDLPEKALAPWRLRAAALVVDVLPGVAAVTALALASFTLPVWSAWWWVCMSVLGVVVLAVLVNRLLLPSITGWSLGRALFGVAVVRRDGGELSPWRLLLRELAHLLDTAAVLVGWLWPLWDSGRRTFADMVTGTEVLRVVPHEQPEKVRQWTAVALLVAASICLDAAGVAYQMSYSPAQAVDRTRAEISSQGPTIVAQMLTYDPATLHDDFARALALTTDKYRPQLAEEQQKVQKRNPVVNEYWVTANSILSATTDRATMLLFMQGRRGTGPDVRYITATVRVKFVKDHQNHWRVDELTPVTSKLQPGAK